MTGAGEVTGGPMQNMALGHTGDLRFRPDPPMGPSQESLNGTNPIAPGPARWTMSGPLFPVCTRRGSTPRRTRLRGHHLAVGKIPEVR